MNNLSLLQQIRGSMKNPEPLSEENFCKVAEPGLTFAEAKKVCAAAGVDIGKIIVDLQRTICNIYYADYENGVYFPVELTSKLLPGGGPVFKAYTMAQKRARYLKERDWSNYYLIAVPAPLQIWDFQKRYREIEPERVFEIWSGIYQKLDYANGQWNPEVLEYVFSQAPEVKGLPVNENGKVTVYRGNGTLSVPPEEAFSWSTNRINALWFANRSGTGQAVYEGEVAPEKVVAYFEGFQNENEILVRPRTVENIRALDLIPVSQKEMVRMLMPTLPELIRYGRYASELGYPTEGVFDFHGKKHILRVLLLGLIYFYNVEPALNLLDKKILIYFALLHDLGRTNDEKDDAHGAKSVRRIIKEHIDIPELQIGRRGREVAQFIIRYHSLPDEAGYQAIRKNSRITRGEAEHLKLLYEICKDIDGLDRVRFNGLDLEQLRTPYARRLALVAGALLQEEIEQVVESH